MSSKRALVLAQNGQVPNDFQEKRALYSLARDDNFKSISDQLKIREKEITKSESAETYSWKRQPPEV